LGKHVRRKAGRADARQALDLYGAAKAAESARLVQDKLWLPRLLKMKMRSTPAFRRILSVRGEFGYWVRG
jgi:hypothetical protein